MTALIPDEKWRVLHNRKHFLCVKIASGYHLGPVAPTAADVASFTYRNLSGQTNIHRIQAIQSHFRTTKILVQSAEL